MDEREPFLYDRLVTEESLSIQFRNEIDEILAGSQWGQWRIKRSNDRRLLEAGARAWCVSSHWDSHTPPLEDWKEVFQDIRSARLTADVLAEMAAASKRRICFPPIPLFEREQVIDVIGSLMDPVAVAVMAEQISQFDSLLTVKHDEIPRTCWEMMPSQSRARWEYPAWRWLVFVPDAGPMPWPSDAGFTMLSTLQHPRQAEALRWLEASAAEAVSHRGPDPRAVRIATHFAELRGPSAVVELQALLRRDAPGTAPFELPPQDEIPDSELGRNERLCIGLFEGPLDMSQWRVAEFEAKFPPNGAAPHPIAQMVDFLRQRYLPESLDQEAWTRLATVLRECGGLLDANARDRCRPLPVLELAASIRSTASLGEVAIDLISVAGDRRSDPRWWRALRAELRPLVRRTEWMLANDRIAQAVAAVEWRAQWLNADERQAFDTGFARELKQ